MQFGHVTCPLAIFDRTPDSAAAPALLPRGSVQQTGYTRHSKQCDENYENQAFRKIGCVIKSPKQKDVTHLSGKIVSALTTSFLLTKLTS